ncbi:hypothetical protein ABZP36_027627 [Zizania latifolia]
MAAWHFLEYFDVVCRIYLAARCWTCAIIAVSDNCCDSHGCSKAIYCFEFNGRFVYLSHMEKCNVMFQNDIMFRLDQAAWTDGLLPKFQYYAISDKTKQINSIYFPHINFQTHKSK